MFGDQTMEVAQKVKELVDEGGLTQREIATQLGLGEGKTGTSQVRRLLKLANEGYRTPAPPPQRERKPQGYEYVASPSTIKQFVLHATPAKAKKAAVHTASLTETQVRSLTSYYEAQGYTVTVEEMN